ncbi:DUF397 domain-containing protein [Streptomyces sp. NPDC017890]|uniref:DUF397 domain-containing protein n=1 Tax=Streptomyces sp. NPDC017890 TaxID=3365015 RepID=UPI0037ACBF6F
MSTSELDWYKSSYSSAQGDSCIEVAITEQTIHVRDSKDVSRPPFTMTRESWAYFVVFVAARG